LADEVHAADAPIIDNLLVRTHFIIVMIRWTGLAPWAYRADVVDRDDLADEVHAADATGLGFRV